MHLVARRPHDTRAFLVTDVGRPVGVAVLDEIRRGSACSARVSVWIHRGDRRRGVGSAAFAPAGRSGRRPRPAPAGGGRPPGRPGGSRRPRRDAASWRSACPVGTGWWPAAGRTTSCSSVPSHRVAETRDAPAAGGYSPIMALRVVFADDNYLVREGVAALMAEVDDIDLVETRRRPAVAAEVGGRAQAGRRAHRHPDAPDVHHRGHRRGEADPRGLPRHRCRGPLAVRRGGVRLRAARERRGRPRLPAEGAGLPARRAGPRPARGRPRRVRPRPEGGRGADGPQGERGEVAAARPHREGARRCSRRWRPGATTRPSPRRCS